MLLHAGAFLTEFIRYQIFRAKFEKYFTYTTLKDYFGDKHFYNARSTPACKTPSLHHFVK